MAAKIRTVRVTDALWEAAQTKAADEGRPLAEVIVTALSRYVARPVRKP